MSGLLNPAAAVCRPQEHPARPPAAAFTRNRADTARFRRPHGRCGAGGRGTRRTAMLPTCAGPVRGPQTDAGDFTASSLWCRGEEGEGGVEGRTGGESLGEDGKKEPVLCSLFANRIGREGAGRVDGLCSVCPQLSHPGRGYPGWRRPLAAGPLPPLISSQSGSFFCRVWRPQRNLVGWRSAGSMPRMLQGGMRVHALQIQSNCTHSGLRMACWGWVTDAGPACTCPAWHSQNCTHTLCCPTEPTFLATCALIPPAPAGQAVWPRNPACCVPA